MPHRDPQTGQFVADSDRFDDYEVVTFSGGLGIQAADLTGGTGFSGGQSLTFDGTEVLDYDEVVDRNEELHLLEAQHALMVFANSTSTADGTVSAAAEISASPSRSAAANVITSTTATDDDPVVGAAFEDDTIDVLGRVLHATGHSPFSDSAGGVGGAGSAGEDSVTVEMPPEPVARFHPRDELFLNGELVIWNIDDSGVHLAVQGQHVYGVSHDM